MNPLLPPLDDAQLFELLEHPENWPEDPETQAKLAEMLELHLGLMAYGSALEATVPLEAHPRPFLTWALAAAAILLLALAPLSYTLYRTHHIQGEARARVDELARIREQGRNWVTFFQQCSMLMQDLDHASSTCSTDGEDRSMEWQAAQDLLRMSHQLGAQEAPTSDAEQLRSQIHTWLQEIALEDTCLSSHRVQELRQMARHQNLGNQADQMGRRLKGEPS